MFSLHFQEFLQQHDGVVDELTRHYKQLSAFLSVAHNDDGTLIAPPTTPVDPGTLAPHASTHEDGGSDPIPVTALGGFPGTSSVFLRGDGTFATPAAAPRDGLIGLTIDGGASPITMGVKGFLRVPFACAITGWSLLSTDAAATAGSIVLDLWKDTFLNYPPTVADSICAGAKPTLASANKNENTALVGWTTTIAAGDVLGVNVDSVSGLTRVALSLAVRAN